MQSSTISGILPPDLSSKINKLHTYHIFVDPNPTRHQPWTPCSLKRLLCGEAAVSSTCLRVTDSKVRKFREWRFPMSWISDLLIFLSLPPTPHRFWIKSIFAVRHHL